MTEKRNEMHLPSIDDLFTTQEQRDEQQLDKIINIQKDNKNNSNKLYIN